MNRDESLHKEKLERIERKSDVMRHYSGEPPHCVMCGESRLICLSIDHVNGGGTKHIKKIGGGGSTLYSWLRKNNYPKGFQVLCMNCQFVKREMNQEVRPRLLKEYE